MHETEILDVKFPNLYLKQIYDLHETFTRVQLVLIHNAKRLSKKSCDATLGNPNR